MCTHKTIISRTTARDVDELSRGGVGTQRSRLLQERDNMISAARLENLAALTRGGDGDRHGEDTMR